MTTPEGDIKRLRQRAERGDAQAQYELGMKYWNGIGVIKDVQKGERLIHKAAGQEHAEAQQHLAFAYEAGKEVKRDVGKADCWNARILKNTGRVQAYIGPAERLPEDTIERICQRAEQGYAPDQYCLGAAYWKGDGVVQNIGEAVKWYHKSAEQGYAPAQYKLGYVYKFGIYGGVVDKDARESVQWYRLAAEQGLAPACKELGKAYFNGDGVVKNGKTAYIWFSIAHALGDGKAHREKKDSEGQLTPAELAEAEDEAQRMREEILKRQRKPF